MTWGVPIAGQSPYTIHWIKDGQLISDDDQHSLTGTVGMVINKFGPEHAGQYHVVASNAFGVATSKVASVIIHCVDATSVNPVPPYTSWATAANTLQDAVDVAQAGAIILVTNGLYNIGGRVDSNGLTNRVIIDESITVMSVNGYKSTIIEGRLDVATNGPSAVRCVTLNNGSVLAGFTVRNGASLDSGSFDSARSGGGIWTLTTTGARVFNCLITNNYASYGGGGVYNASTFNSVLAGNRSGMAGGGAYNAKMYNCTVIGNSCNSFGGAGVFAGNIYNSIITENYLANWNLSNWGSVQMTNCLSDPIGSPAGVGNISGNPVIIDLDYHISASSICRHTGNAQFAYGEDMDGEPWANPPSIGADEVVEANLVGPISLGIVTQKTNTFVGSYHAMIFGSSITGRVSRIDWNFGDGVVVTNVGNTSPFHWWTNTGTFIVTCTAYNTDNPSGVSAGIEINVLPLVAPLIQAVSLDSAGFKFSFEAQESARYSVQYATNLAAPVTWNTLLSIFYSPGGTTQITDPAWTNSARFYRVLVQ